jgi:hypothetical protein
MSKPKIVTAFAVIIAMSMFLGAAKKPAAPDKSATELALFGPAPDGTMDVVSDGPVLVGVDVQTYSPDLIELFLSEALVSDTSIPAGPHWGKARCLKKNGREAGRLDFYFDCTENDLSTCSYRLIVRFGLYDKKADTVFFDPGSMLLYTTGPDSQLLKEGQASFSVVFP